MSEKVLEMEFQKNKVRSVMIDEMAMSDLSRLVKNLGLSEQEAREIVKDSKGSYNRLGEIFGKKFALGKNYSPRKRKDNPDHPNLFNF